MSELDPVIAYAEAAVEHTHVVVTMSDAGLHVRAESEAACQVMADIIGNCRVMTREQFIADLRALAAEAG